MRIRREIPEDANDDDADREDGHDNDRDNINGKENDANGDAGDAVTMMRRLESQGED
jgi:hypothetical protein